MPVRKATRIVKALLNGVTEQIAELGIGRRIAIAAMDFFTIPIVQLRMLYCFFVIGHEHLLSFDDPESYPELFHLDQRWDCDHPNRGGAEILSALIVEQLAPIVARTTGS